MRGWKSSDIGSPSPVCCNIIEPGAYIWVILSPSFPGCSKPSSASDHLQNQICFKVLNTWVHLNFLFCPHDFFGLFIVFGVLGTWVWGFCDIFWSMTSCCWIRVFVHRFWSGVKHGFRYSQCLLLDFIQKCSSLVPAKASSKAGHVSSHFQNKWCFFITPIFYIAFLQFLPFARTNYTGIMDFTMIYRMSQLWHINC